MHNEAAYIGKLLSSIQRSSVQPDEVIICDNASTDESVIIAKQFEKALPIRIIREPRKGILYAMDSAWKEAKGDIIVRTDADCILPRDWLAKTIDHFRDDPTLAACTGPLKSPDGSIMDKFLTRTWTGYPALIYAFMKSYPVLIGANCAFRKEALEQINGYATPTYMQDDLIISRKLAGAKLKMCWFWDMWMYHSTRRFHGKPQAYIPYALSIFYPKLYIEK
jgi:cellulose synthase/poly-beta-1,6-N-acetylglucosamine synthase-like glycosyltransferase